MSIKISAAAAVMAAALLAFAGATPSEAARGSGHPGGSGQYQNFRSGQYQNYGRRLYRPWAKCVPGQWSPGCAPPNRNHNHNYNYWWGWGFGSWPYYDGYYNYADDYYANMYYSRDRLSCKTGKSRLARKGYSRLVATDCTGRQYVYTGSKNGHKYKFKMNAYTGRYSRYLLK
jgi:hypothetical protein